MNEEDVTHENILRLRQYKAEKTAEIRYKLRLGMYKLMTSVEAKI